MTLALVAASHSPLMADGETTPEVRASVDNAFRDLGRVIEEFQPDVAIQFAPDHLNGFFYDLMPAICVGAGADSIGDWGTKPGPLPVPEDLAVGLTTHLLDEGFDPALSYRMQVDHGFVQFWENSVGAVTVPLIPIFINCAAPPLPTMKRARALGEAVGRYAAGLDRKVLIVASGGLSHDPPTPQIRGAAPELRERLISNRNPSEEARQAREARVLAAGLAAAHGEGNLLPVSPEWDRDFLDRITGDDFASFDRMSIASVVREAGRGGPETLCWVAAMAALRSSGPIQATVHTYETVQGWIAGMAVMSARQAA